MAVPPRIDQLRPLYIERPSDLTTDVRELACAFTENVSTVESIHHARPNSLHANVMT